ncbi:MAG: hypothetical protein HC782_02700 [Gammaproteobacteria bacterium]|nr:hypothetical protein [Gammaproteobacteria bacterium]
MFPKTLKSWIIVLLIFASIVYFFKSRAADKRMRSTGEIAEVPSQINESAAVIIFNSYRIKPMARYQIRAKVLSTERYRFGRDADLSPVDLALGWGPMSDAATIEKLNISQSNRWYSYTWQSTPPIEAHIINSTSANTHMIPANADIKSQLLGIKKGSVVRLEGYLVNVSHADGWSWKTSLSRDDSGGGACELMWVTAVRVE